MALAEEVESENDASFGSKCEEQWKKAFTNCFRKVDAEIGGGEEPVAPETAGSTAVVAIVSPTHVVVANCGDSRAVLCRGKVAVPLSIDHKVRHGFCHVIGKERLIDLRINFNYFVYSLIEKMN